MKLLCRATRKDGTSCPAVLLEVEGGEVRINHHRKDIVLRGMFVSGHVHCAECRTIRYLVAEDFDVGPAAVVVVRDAPDALEAA